MYWEFKLRSDQVYGNEDLIHYIDTEVDEAFIKSTIENASFGTSAGKKRTEYCFTSLHGTSIKLVQILYRKRVILHIVEEQRVPNGDFLR
jgi:phosphomannomutase